MNLLCKFFMFSALLAICLICSRGECEEVAVAATDQKKAQAQQNESNINIGTWLATFFKKHISAVDGDRCPSYPSCSSYSVMAFKKHGFFMGWLMTVDRLIHEADEASISPLVYQNGRIKIFDPVENNDFWWFHLDEKNQD